ncbi:MAG: DOMON-like domain-containing protein [Candidatus Methylomirabilales bacterium]
MRIVPFALQPFSRPPVCLTIHGEVSRTGGNVCLSYRLTGELADVIIPSPASRPSRRHRLWESTCFELFLTPEGGAEYWEVNLSPSGDWNLYRFAAYREAMQEEPIIQELPAAVDRDERRLALSLSLPDVTPGHRTVRIGVSAVLRHTGGRLSYWALRHPGVQPDFHHPSGFVIVL